MTETTAPITARERLMRLRAKLKLDSHHATERFGILVAVFAATFALVVSGTVASAVSNNIAQTSKTALYTPSFTTSKSSLTGAVDGVYVSPDHRRSLVLMQFPSSSASQISENAKNYQAFVTGSDPHLNQQQPDEPLTGRIVVFGATGYLGVVMDSPKPFAQQILNLTVRANAQLVYQPNQTQALSADMKDDASFKKHDQWRVFVNPGASGATTTDAVANAGSAFSPDAAYYDLVVKAQEKAARKTLDSDLAKMQVDLAAIKEYTARMATTQVGGVRIVPPAVPKQIAGDSVTGTAGNASDPLTLHSAWTDPSGYSFDWRDGSVRSGYLDALVPKGKSYVQFLSDKSQAGQNAQDATFDAGQLDFKLSDGTDLSTGYQGSNQALQPLLDVANNLTQAYQTYYNDKVQYQTKDYSALLMLEIGLKNVDSSASTNSSRSALLSY